MKKILVLGASGMLGSMVTDFLYKRDDIELSASFRSLDKRQKFKQRYKDLNCVYLDFFNPVDYSLFDRYLIGYDYIVNCIGATKPSIDETDFLSVRNAIQMNSILPYYLKKVCERNNTILIQILTDCVYKGCSGDYYTEDDIKDAVDVYGKSKIMGEYTGKNIINLRTSIIGPEILSGNKFLFEWFLKNQNDSVNGYTNHFWNGITTLAFAKIVYGVIENNVKCSLLHLYSYYYNKKTGFELVYSKCDLLRLIRSVFDKDIKIIEKKDTFISRVLYTKDKEAVTELWKHAGYRLREGAPNIKYLLKEMKEYMETEWSWR